MSDQPRPTPEPLTRDEQIAHLETCLNAIRCLRLASPESADGRVLVLWHIEAVLAALRPSRPAVAAQDVPWKPRYNRETAHCTFNGGHHEDCCRAAFHHGMDTVFNLIDSDSLFAAPMSQDVPEGETPPCKHDMVIKSWAPLRIACLYCDQPEHDPSAEPGARGPAQAEPATPSPTPAGEPIIQVGDVLLFNGGTLVLIDGRSTPPPPSVPKHVRAIYRAPLWQRSGATPS